MTLSTTDAAVEVDLGIQDLRPRAVIPACIWPRVGRAFGAQDEPARTGPAMATLSTHATAAFILRWYGSHAETFARGMQQARAGVGDQSGTAAWARVLEGLRQMAEGRDSAGATTRPE